MSKNCFCQGITSHPDWCCISNFSI